MISRPDLPIVSFLAAFLVLIPLPWHWRARNVATLSTIGWLFVMNFLRGLSSIFWADNVDIKYKVFCDITTKLVVGISFALPGTSLCICRYLAGVAAVTAPAPTERDKKRRFWFEMFICNGIPVIAMALHYVVQGHRFDLLENFGCHPSTYISWPALVILWVPVLILSLLTLIYSGMALRFFILRRIEFGLVLDGASTTLTSGRYLRLIGLAVSEMIWGTAIGSYTLFLNVSQGGLRVYDNWAHVHSYWDRVDVYPARFFPKITLDLLLLSWWIVPASAFLFFLFFGFGQEAMKEYRLSINWFRRTILGHQIATQKSTTSVPSMPVHMRVKLDQLDNISISGYDPKWDAPPTSTASVSSFAKAREGGRDHEAASLPRGSIDLRLSDDDAISPVENTMTTKHNRKDSIV